MTSVLRDNQADALLLNSPLSVVAAAAAQSCGSDQGKLSLQGDAASDHMSLCRQECHEEVRSQKSEVRSNPMPKGMGLK